MNIQEIEESKINPATYKPRIDLQLNNLEYKKIDKRVRLYRPSDLKLRNRGFIDDN